LHYSPFWVKKIFPVRIWDYASLSVEKSIYLTFDDGPVPEVTPWVLEVLKKYDVKATFFCVGNNIQKYPYLLETIHEQGHTIGNHTFNHKNGFNTPIQEYIQDILLTQDTLNKILPYQTPYFRPPYGRLTFSQARHIAKTHKIVMWSVLSGDFDTQISGETVLQKTLQYTKPGSVVVFHDSIKAFSRLEYALPRYIEECLNMGYTFEPFAVHKGCGLSVAV
jgi:peptidoglycan/xylan/chitin deacetylase (PgdA/CDA1 family)